MQYNNGYYGSYLNSPYLYNNGYLYPQNGAQMMQNAQSYQQQPQNINQQQQPAQTQQQVQQQPQMQSQQYQAQQPQQQSQMTNSFVWAWVQGDGGMQAYPVAPNSMVLLMDTIEPRMCMKSADANGRPQAMEIQYLVSKEDYAMLQELKKSGAEQQPKVEYATKEDLKKFMTEVENKYMVKKEAKKNNG